MSTIESIKVSDYLSTRTLNIFKRFFEGKKSKLVTYYKNNEYSVFCNNEIINNEKIYDENILQNKNNISNNNKKNLKCN